MVWTIIDPVDQDGMRAGECSWPIVPACDAADANDAAVTEWSQQFAVEILWAASGRQYGVCTSTFRPCARSCSPDWPFNDQWNLAPNAGQEWSWSRFVCGRCAPDIDCRCSSVESFRLWHRNVATITNVTIDGAVLNPGAYRLSGNRLIRTDGQPWPTCQDWNVDAGEIGSWSVTYPHGNPVPGGGQVAAGILACELAASVLDPDECKLPQRTQTVTRQGVTIGFLDPMNFLDKGLTGLYEVDLWLMTVNPARLQRRARVHRARLGASRGRREV